MALIEEQKAREKLQITKGELSKLLILHGFYPRNVKNGKLYFASDDIKRLQKSPIYTHFADLKAFNKKVKKRFNRKEDLDAKKLKKQAPHVSYEFLVRERYPTLDSAIKALNDALPILSLYAAVSTDTGAIGRGMVDRCKRACRAFHYYLTRTRSLRAVFISVKGVYLRASVHGVDITWVMPHQFAQQRPEDVNLHTMKTFLQFYLLLVDYVNKELAAELGVSYPIAFNPSQDSAGMWLAAATYEEEAKSNPAVLPLRFAVTPSSSADESSLHIHSQQHVFEGLSVEISTECGYSFLELCLRAGGAEVHYGGYHDGESLEERGSRMPHEVSKKVDGYPHRITHVISDRPKVIRKRTDVEYIQPQWVFDCFNFGTLLPCPEYFVGE
ncbi:Pescadillo like protein, partial [Aduncisulcus paluster]